MADRSPQRRRATFEPPDPRSIAQSTFDFDRHFSPAEWEQIRLGLVADSLPDDRWTIVERDGSVYFNYYFHNVYKVDFSVDADGATARRAVVNMRRAFFNEELRTYYARDVSWLIDFWLLGHPFRDPPKAPVAELPAGIELVRDPMPFIPGLHALAFGAKDSGRIGGGAAAAILAAAGPKFSKDTNHLFAQSERKVGDVVVTQGHGLLKWGIQYVCHIVSIATHTSQGDWCPYPEKLYDGVRNGLRELAKVGAGTIAMSALATGEGRVAPERVAKEMLTAIRDHQRERKQKGRFGTNVVLSLPTFEDYEAFNDYLAR